METLLRMSITIYWPIFVAALIPFTPLFIGAIKNPKDESQNFITWFLYCALDIITMLSSKEEGSQSYSLLFGFAVGSFLMSAILFYQGRIGWSLLETITIVLVGLCIFIWVKSGTYWALRFGITSESIVGIYLIIKTFKKPTVEYNLIAYLGFLIVSILTIFTAKEFSVPEVGYAMCETILTFITMIPLLIKWLADSK